MAYVGNQPVPQATQTRDRFVATSGQTSFATSGYTPNFVDVYLDGVKLDSSEYTATNGSDVVLASGASTGQIMEVVAFSSFDVADIRNMTQPLGLKNYTTTQRNALTGIGAGDTIYNSTIGSIEFYDGTNWIATNLIPVLSSVSGTIYSGVSSTLTLSVSNTTETVDIKYYEGGTLLATDTAVTVTSNSCTSTVPSAVYGQTAGDTISIQVFNLDGTPSNAILKTVLGIPSGGTITSTGGYRYHTFTSSSSLVVPTGFTASAEYLIVAGGGGGGSTYHGAGGGAGGAIDSTTTLSAQTYSITVGSGGSGGAAGSPGDRGDNGNNSSAFSQTAIGGGGGASYGFTSAGGASGGSGGGGAQNSSGSTQHLGGAGTSGQGNAGGNTSSGGSWLGGGGGGGASAAGGNGSGSGDPTLSVAGAGGDGINWKSLGTYYAGGGSGSYGTGGTSAPAGLGGGGAGSNHYGANGSANTGGGGGGSERNDPSGSFVVGGNGGSGIVIVRYQLP